MATTGGFMLSPAASSVTSSSSNTKPTLPHPRNTPLRPGGSKQGTFIRYADQQLLHIQRRFAKRTTPSLSEVPEAEQGKADTWGDVKGYSSMKEVCKDIEALLNIVWTTGTPSLQVPYLISMGLLVRTVVQTMPATPKSLFKLLNKLDHAFVSLLQGADVETREPLPGFAGGRGVSGTEKVRIRGLVERTRVDVIERFKGGHYEDEDEDEDDDDRMDTDADSDGELILEGDGFDAPDEHDDSIDMQLARVYDRTISELGDALEDPSIGIITE